MDFIDRLDQLFQDEKDKNHKLTRAQFAAFAGVSYDQITGWYRGSVPDFDTLKQLAKRYHVTVSWLVGETDVKYDASIALQQLAKGLTAEDMQHVKVFIGYLQHLKTVKPPKQ